MSDLKKKYGFLSYPTIKENDDGSVSLIFEKKVDNGAMFMNRYETVGKKEIKFNNVEIIED